MLYTFASAHVCPLARLADPLYYAYRVDLKVQGCLCVVPSCIGIRSTLACRPKSRCQRTGRGDLCSPRHIVTVDETKHSVFGRRPWCC
jgi:hypothetical protein